MSWDGLWGIWGKLGVHRASQGNPGGTFGRFGVSFEILCRTLGRFRGAVGHVFSVQSPTCVLLGNRRTVYTGSSFSRPRAAIWVAKPLLEQSPRRCSFFSIFQKHSDRVGSEILKFEPL